MKKVLLSMPWDPKIVTELDDYLEMMKENGFEVVLDPRQKRLTEDELIELMVGRPLEKLYDHNKPIGGETVLEAKNFCNKKLKNVSISLRKGEILGFSGLVGAGRTELARAIFGLDSLDSGELIIEGKPVKIKNPQDAIDHHIALVPEDRKNAGLVLINSVGFNLTLTVLKEFIRGPFVNEKKENEIIES